MAIGLLALPLLGMGALGGGPSGAPSRNYEGTFVDRDGTKVEAKWITVGGDVSLPGALGRGDLRISFDEIRTVEFSGEAAKDLMARVTLRKGDPVEVKVRGSLAFAGQSRLGAYQIRARDLKSVEFRSE